MCEGDVPLVNIVDKENRTAWIRDKVDLAKRQFMDGINIDIEQAVDKGSPEYQALTDLVRETTEAFHREIPGSQVIPFIQKLKSVLISYHFEAVFDSLEMGLVTCRTQVDETIQKSEFLLIRTFACLPFLSDLQVSFDVAWSPNCIDRRCYDYVSIAESCDLLFVMSYDEQSQIMGDCIAMANAPVNQTLNGLLSNSVKLNRKQNYSAAAANQRLHVSVSVFKLMTNTWV